MNKNMDTLYREFCRELAEKHQLRRLVDHFPSAVGQVRRDVRDLVNFSSNDYLGLSRSRFLRQRAISFAQQYGLGATASRLMAGNLAVFEEIEARLAKSIGAEGALVFAPGYQANLTAIAALLDFSVLGRKPVVFCDRLNHNSILQGVKLAGAEMHRYQHLDLPHLEKLLQKSDGEHARFIISETVFGMDGDKADIGGLVALSKKYDAFLILDDAHAFGIYGANGFGMASDYAKDIDMITGTFGKAFGSYGSYVACSASLREYLINRCDGFKYTTALPPMVWGAIDAAIEIMPDLAVARARILSNAVYVRSALKNMGYDTGSGDSHIIPVMVGKEKDTMALDEFLQSQGILAVAVRPPTVPPHSSRIRLSMMASHAPQQLDQLIRALQHWREKMDKTNSIAA